MPFSNTYVHSQSYSLSCCNNIREGHIAQYAENGKPAKTPMPVNALHQLYNFENPNGLFNYVDIVNTDLVSFEMEYKNNNLIKSAVAKPQNKTTNSASTQAREVICTVYYLEVTNYTAAGEIIDTYDIYLTTICAEGGSDGGGTTGGGSGGEGDGGGPANEQCRGCVDTLAHMAATAQSTWQVAMAESRLWRVWSTERFNGEKYPGHPGNNIFYSISHLSSNITASGAGNATWREWGCTPSLYTASIAKSIVEGAVSFDDGNPPQPILNRFQLFPAFSIFP